MPYLVEADVRATVTALAARSAPGGVVVVNYRTPPDEVARTSQGEGVS